MIQKLVLLFVSVLISMPVFGVGLSAILEGTERELSYGDVATLTFTVWPVSNKEEYLSILKDEVFLGTIKILAIKSVDFSEYNEEALVFTFSAAILGSELPDSLIYNDMDVSLMKRNIHIVEFHPESEQIFLFLDSIPERFKHTAVIVFFVLCFALIVGLLVQKVLTSRKLKLILRARHSEVFGHIKSLDILNRVDYLYKNEDIWLKYYDRQKWRTVKNKLNELVYKKELSTEEKSIIRSEVESILSEVEKWNT